MEPLAQTWIVLKAWSPQIAARSNVCMSNLLSLQIGLHGQLSSVQFWCRVKNKRLKAFSPISTKFNY